MVTQPYNLKNGKLNSNGFYLELSEFTDDFINQNIDPFNELLSEFDAFKTSQNIKKYSKNEYLIELLTIGVLWNNYHKYYSVDAIFLSPLFNVLYNLRKRNPRLKNRIDKLRGKLNYKILLQQKNKNIEIHQQFDYQVKWLSATKEYNAEVKRMKVWQNWIEQMPLNSQTNFWNMAIDLANTFTNHATKILEKYTSNWENFMMDTVNTYPKREDQIFCTRKPSEYYLNMVAAQVLNKALKRTAESTNKKIVLLPTCMAANENCKAKIIDNKLTCQHCSSSCNVSLTTTKLNKEGVSTVLIPHSTGFSKYIRPWKDSKDTSLYGVACVLNLIKGGYEMQNLNIPSQCVFLDSCSCKNHWLSGEPTQINQEQLFKALKVKDAKKQPVNSSC